MTRRRFTSMFAAAAQAGTAGKPAAVKDAVQPKVRPFPMKQVRLLNSNYYFLSERNRGYLHDLESDRLLHTFRVTAGLPSSAEPLGGWESPVIELRGHFTGHYLSGCALMYVNARDQLLKTKADALVAELAKCQKANGNGYLSAFPPESFDRLKNGTRVWAPWYTVHKIMAGLLDMHILAGNEQALSMLEGMAGWAKRWADPLSDEHMARVLDVEYGGMNDLLYNLYAVTGKEEYAALAHRFDHKRIFDPLAEGRDQLKGLHVNTQIPKIIGAARRYELTGEKRYRDIAEFFWRQVVDHRAYCTGGTSNFQGWRSDPDKLAAELSHTTQECCCTYNMLKLTRHIFSWTADAHCGDYYERTLLNGIIGTMNPKDGMTMYYLPLASGYWKMFGTPRRTFWCCTGSGVESFSKLGDSIYFHDGQALYVNLFIPSRLEWPEKGVRVRQETRFPDEAGTSFLFEAEKPVELALRIRVPYWATRGLTARVNGQPVEASAQPGGFQTISRSWKTGDKVEVSFPMSLHMHPMPDDAGLQAVMYGPLVLAGQLGIENLTWEQLSADPVETRRNQALRGDPVPAPEFRAASPDPSAWIKTLPGDTLAFRTSGQARDVTLIPLNQLFEERYAVYWRVHPV